MNWSMAQWEEVGPPMPQMGCMELAFGKIYREGGISTFINFKGGD